MLARKLILHGKSPRLWQAEAKGQSLGLVTGTPKKLAATKKQVGNFASVVAALRTTQLAKLRAGYVLDGPQGTMAGMLAVATWSTVDLSPDGSTVWSLTSDTSGQVTLRVRELSTGELLHERVLDETFIGTRRLLVRSRTQALLGTFGRGLVRYELDGQVTQISDRRNKQLEVGALRGAGDRVVVVMNDDALLLDADTGKQITRIPQVKVVAISGDATRLVVCNEMGSELIVLDARDGRELTRISLGKGEGVRTLAITPEHVVAGGIWFAKDSRHGTWVWSLPSGARALTKLFPNDHDFDHISSAFGANLIALAGVYGRVEIYDVSKGTLKLCSNELGRTAKGTTLRATADGRWLLAYDGSGLVVVWDFSKLLAGEGENEDELTG